MTPRAGLSATLAAGTLAAGALAAGALAVSTLATTACTSSDAGVLDACADLDATCFSNGDCTDPTTRCTVPSNADPTLPITCCIPGSRGTAEAGAPVHGPGRLPDGDLRLYPVGHLLLLRPLHGGLPVPHGATLVRHPRRRELLRPPALIPVTS